MAEQGSRVTDEDLVEAVFRMLNRRSGPRFSEPALDAFALDGELVIRTPEFRATWGRGGIETLISALPATAVFGYCEVLRDGAAVVGHFTATSGGLALEPTLGRYVLRCAGDRILRLELEVRSPGASRELSALMA